MLLAYCQKSYHSCDERQHHGRALMEIEIVLAKVASLWRCESTVILRTALATVNDTQSFVTLSSCCVRGAAGKFLMFLPI